MDRPSAPGDSSRRASLAERQLSLILRPINDLEDHSAPEHFGFEIGRVKLPFGGLPDTKPAFFT